MIAYLKGDATKPIGERIKIIASVNNDSGGWGRGFVVAISARWQEPEKSYREWHRNKNGFILGEVQYVKVAENIIVANMLAQHGYSTRTISAIRYDSLRSCLIKVSGKAKELGATIHMPRIGCGLAGGKWEEVSKIIEETMDDVQVFVYDL